MLNRAYSFLEIKAVDEDQRVITGVATTPDIDRVGDSVNPFGAKFAATLPLLWQHDRYAPVGTVVFGAPTAKGIPFTARLPKVDEPSQLKARIEEAWQSVKHGLVRAVSIGFRTLESDLIEATGGFFIKSLEIIELSLVTIPANASATIETVKSFDVGVQAALGSTNKTASTDTSSGASETPVITVKLAPKEGIKTMSIREQIAAFQAERAKKVAEMEKMLSEKGDEAKSFNADQSKAYDALDTEIKEIEAHLARLEGFLAIQAKKMTPVAPATDEKSASEVRQGVVAPATVKTKREPGLGLARVAKCLGISARHNVSAVDVATGRYGNTDPEIVNVVKASVAAATTDGSTWAKPLVGDETSVYADFVEYLRPQTILGKFGTAGIPSLRRIPFRTALVGQTTGGTGFWVGEGNAKPLTKFDFSRTTLEPLKVANIAVATEEVLMSSSPSADMIIRDSLAAALLSRLDADFVDPTKAASAGVSPASITYGLSAVTSSGNTADDIRVDMKALYAQFIAANNTPTNGVWIMSSTTALAMSLMVNALGQREFPQVEMLGGRLNGLPVITSEYLPTDSNGSIVMLVNASDIYLGDEGGVRIDISREASLEMSDSPSHDSDTPTAAQLVSMFQTNSVAFRAERIINWKARRSSAVALLDSVNWGDSI